MTGARLTNLETLLGIAMIQQWLRMPQPEGRWWGPGWFSGNSCRPLTTLTNDNRKTTLRLARIDACPACGLPVADNSTGDHIIPRAIGGPDTPDNFIPMCRSCNSSKGTKELLEWWHQRGTPFVEILPDVMTAYARISYHWLNRRGELPSEAPPFRRWPIREFYEVLPTDAHRAAFVQAMRP